MPQRLHHLNALRAFEVACREGSFTAAARELSVTPGAVSRQVAILEADLGCPLFVRHARGVEPTAKGAALYKVLRESFDRIESTLRAVREDTSFSSLSVLTYTTIALEWLVQRIGNYQRANPGGSLNFYAMLKPDALFDRSVDAGVWSGPGDWPKVVSKDMFFPQYLPLASPKLKAMGLPFARPEDLAQHVLVGSTFQIPAWRAWLRAAGVDEAILDHMRFFDTSAQAYREARDGKGIMLGYHLINAYDLAAGTLFAPFDIAVRDSRAWRLIVLEDRQDEPRIRAFERWLFAELSEAERVARSVMPKNMKITDAAIS